MTNPWSQHELNLMLEAVGSEGRDLLNDLWFRVGSNKTPSEYAEHWPKVWAEMWLLAVETLDD